MEIKNAIKPRFLNPLYKNSKKHKSESFSVNDLKISLTKKPLQKPDFLNKPLPFGVYHTDHMLEVDYSNEKGWKNPEISQYHNFSIDPFNSTLHYAIQLFEGLKAFKCDDNRIILFRPEQNMIRMNNSAKRLSLPKFDGEELLKCIEQLIKIDREWIPKRRGYSLYIRPTYISMTNQLGVLPPRDAKIFVVMSPVGPYFPTGFNAINITCNDSILRSWPGGFGYAKLGANYGPTLEYYKEIQQKGFQQVLWLINDRITEVGVMNFFVYWVNKKGEKEVVTCPLDGTILPGVMRDSVIKVANEWGIHVSERDFYIQEVIEAIEEKRVIEAFGTGTAAIICPIKSIYYKGNTYTVLPDSHQNVGELGERLYDHILDIQLGMVKDHPWQRIIKY